MSPSFKLIRLNAFQILLFVIIISLIITNNWVNCINYVLNMETFDYWFLVIHIIILYIVLSSLQLEMGFRAYIKI